MKLKHLYIERHLLLRALDLDFDRPGRLDIGQYALDFLVGVNGSGKSTVLRALAQILLDLRADRITDFDYKLEYDFQGQNGPYRVLIWQAPNENGSTTRHMTVWRSDLPDDPIYDEVDAVDGYYLPERVVVYTTGYETGWEQILAQAREPSSPPTASEAVLKDPVQRNIVALPGHLPYADPFQETAPEEQPVLLIRNSRLFTVTLCGLLAHLASSEDQDQRPLTEVLGSLGLQHVRGFSLRFRLHTALSPFETFERLAPLATRHIRQGNDHLLVFDLSDDDHEIPTTLLEESGGGLAFFEELDQLQEPSQSGEPTLQKINIFLERDVPPTIDSVFDDGPASYAFLLDWLSDGEQSFLGRMALLAMLDTEDSLILLDEPEAHFNDYWKREVIDLLDRIMQEHSNHLLITSHSSILLSDVTEAHVIAMVRGADGWAQRHFLRLPLLAVDPSEIMVNWFGTGRSVGQRSTRLLSAAVERDDTDELERLLGVVGPGYWRYRIEDRLEELHAASD
jgi:energy-coupling factor transporter ATP-binding protein EcfA2